MWSAQAASDTASYQGNAVIWDGAQFVMVGDKHFGVAQPPLIATSPDGVTWTKDYEGTTTGQAVLNGLASSGSRVVAVGGVKMLTLP